MSRSYRPPQPSAVAGAVYNQAAARYRDTDLFLNAAIGSYVGSDDYRETVVRLAAITEDFTDLFVALDDDYFGPARDRVLLGYVATLLGQIVAVSVSAGSPRKPFGITTADGRDWSYVSLTDVKAAVDDPDKYLA